MLFRHTLFFPFLQECPLRRFSEQNFRHHNLCPVQSPYISPSAHTVYMDENTEYDAAMALTGSFDYWRTMLKSSTKIRKQIEIWREEKSLKDQAKARGILWREAEKGNTSAAKIIYEAKKEEQELKRREKAQTVRDTRETELLAERLRRLTDLKAI